MCLCVKFIIIIIDFYGLQSTTNICESYCYIGRLMPTQFVLIAVFILCTLLISRQKCVFITIDSAPFCRCHLACRSKESTSFIKLLPFVARDISCWGFTWAGPHNRHFDISQSKWLVLCVTAFSFPLLWDWITSTAQIFPRQIRPGDDHYLDQELRATFHTQTAVAAFHCSLLIAFPALR